MESVESKTTSLGERLLKARGEKQEQEGEFTGTIQMAGGQLVITYRALGYREDRRIGQRHRSVPDEIEREVRLAADTLAASSTGTTAEVDGESHNGLPPLGLKLAEDLGIEGPENDIQAVLALFPSERAMVEQFVELETWASEVNRRVDDGLTGEPRAPSR